MFIYNLCLVIKINVTIIKIMLHTSCCDCNRKKKVGTSWLFYDEFFVFFIMYILYKVVYIMFNFFQVHKIFEKLVTSMCFETFKLIKS